MTIFKHNISELQIFVYLYVDTVFVILCHNLCIFIAIQIFVTVSKQYLFTTAYTVQHNYTDLLTVTCSLFLMMYLLSMPEELGGDDGGLPR